MSLTLLFFLFLLGAIVGVLAGMMGIGGGMIMVPFVVTVLNIEGYPVESQIKMAIGTSLATIIFTSMSSVLSHHKRGSVVWPVVRLMAPGIMLGALIGSQLVGLAPARLVAAVFSVFLLYSAWSVAIRKRKDQPTTRDSRPKRSELAIGGLGIGAVASVVGAGGGFLTIPFLMARGMLPTRAVGCSSACGLPIAIAGTVGYILAGLDTNLPGPVIGYLHVPALLAISAASVLTAPTGVRLAHILPPATLKKMFGGILLLLAIYMLVRSLTA